jgi:hypothetical protein
MHVTNERPSRDYCAGGNMGDTLTTRAQSFTLSAMSSKPLAMVVLVGVLVVVTPGCGDG